jgi:hypothetical protein
MSAGRRAPRLVIELELEREHARVALDVATFEDARRLRVWLRGSSCVDGLPLIVEALLDELDRADEDRAA